MLRVRKHRDTPEGGKCWRVYREHAIAGFTVPKVTLLAAFYDFPTAVQYAAKVARLWEKQSVWRTGNV